MNGRPHIGLLAANLTDIFSNDVTRGAMLAAKRLGADLTVLPGKYLGIQSINDQYDAHYEYQYNVLFDYAAGAKFDYIIAAVGTIAFAFGDEEKKRFLDSLGPSPVLSVASRIEGYDYLIFENSRGISDAVDFLAARGRKNIAILAGEKNNFECIERLSAYISSLERNGLVYREELRQYCDISYDCGPQIEELLDRCPEIDAVICVNDIIASVIYEVLKKRGVSIGEQIAVVGFDDQPFAARLDPPLSSVKADAVELGIVAMEKAVAYVNGQQDSRHKVETRFVARESCYADTRFQISTEEIAGCTASQLKELFYTHISKTASSSRECEELYSPIETLLTLFEERFIRGTVDSSGLEQVTEELRELVRRSGGPEGPMSRLHTAFEDVGLWLLRNCSAENAAYVRRLFSGLGSVGGSSSVVPQKFHERSHYENLFIRDSMMFVGDMQKSYADILKRLSNIGCMTGYLYTLEQPLVHNFGTGVPGDLRWYFKSYCYGAELHMVPEEEQAMGTPEVFSNKYLAAERQHTFIAAVLYTAETQYGLALLEPEDESFFDELELVTFQLSSAVRTLDILKKQDRLVSEIHSRNLALEELSKIDELTGIYNRRGFYLAADELMGGENGRYIVCYADMDDLKKVNDSYGHAEGDVCIRQVARCLEEVLGEKAIIGRMGGDEFAAVRPFQPGDDTKAIFQSKCALVNRLSQDWNKPYKFDISMGVLECECSSSYDLRAAMDKADDSLYLEKSMKKRAKAQ